MKPASASSHTTTRLSTKKTVVLPVKQQLKLQPKRSGPKKKGKHVLQSKKPQKASSRSSNTASTKTTQKLVKPEGENGEEGENDSDEYEYDEDEDPTKVYCYCRKTYDPSLFYIQCDGCDEWYHGICANMNEEQAERIFLWFCRICERDSGRRPVFKKFCAGWLAGETYRTESEVLGQYLEQLKQQFGLLYPPLSSPPLEDSSAETPTTTAESTPPISESPESPLLKGIHPFKDCPDSPLLLDIHPLADSPESPTCIADSPESPVPISEEDFHDALEDKETDSNSIDIEAVSALESPIPRPQHNQNDTQSKTLSSQSHLPPQLPTKEPSQQTENPQPLPQFEVVYATQISQLTSKHLSHLYKTPTTCLKYLPDPIAPHLLPKPDKKNPTSTTNPDPTSISGGTNSRYCSDTCGLSISHHALQKHLASLHPRVHVHPKTKLRERCIEDLTSMEEYDKIDSEKLKLLFVERVSVGKWVWCWEEGRRCIEGCLRRKEVCNGLLGVVVAAAEEEDKENYGDGEEGFKKLGGGGGRKKKRRRKNRAGDDVVEEEKSGGGVSKICGFDSRIVNVWFKRIDCGEALRRMDEGL
ncbi:UNVERIFIED_CONTAM: hypothetical protein HDU68_007851, partial [Siphonaria sp. JEL0065]